MFKSYITPELQSRVAGMRDHHTIVACNDIQPGGTHPSRVVTRDLKNNACSFTSRTRSAPAKKGVQGKVPQMQKARNSKGPNVAPPKRQPRISHPKGK